MFLQHMWGSVVPRRKISREVYSAYLETVHTERDPGNQTAAQETEEGSTDPGEVAGLHSHVCGHVGLARGAAHTHWATSYFQRGVDYHHLWSRARRRSVGLLWILTSKLLLAWGPISILLLTIKVITTYIIYKEHEQFLISIF